MRTKFLGILFIDLIAYTSAFDYSRGLNHFCKKIQSSITMSQESLKRNVGYLAIDQFVSSGMKVGLGTGSTAYYAVERLGQKLGNGSIKDVICVPTSERTKEQALSLNIPLSTLDEIEILDVTIDGADDVDLNLNLIKGGGGALLREKMVEVSSKKFICIVDESKLSNGLGPNFPLPVEITPFCYKHTIKKIESLPSLVGCKAVLRMGSSSNNKNDGSEIAITDNGNYIADIHFQEPIKDVQMASKELKELVGVVEHGIFNGLCNTLIVGGKDGIRIAGEKGESPWWS